MISRFYLCVVSACLLLVSPVHGEQPKNVKEVTPEQARKTLERALTFMIKDAELWRKERGCATCHHGTMTIWALSEARSQGHAVNADSLADMLQWSKERFVPRFSVPRDPRPGWRLVSIAGIHHGIMSYNLPVLSREEMHRLSLHLARHQEEDGGFESPPPKNGAPPIWESRETVALLAALAWDPFEPADAKDAALIRTGREKLTAFLSKNRTTDSTQAAALRLLLEVRTRNDAKDVQTGIDALVKRQNPDGGWSQVKGIPSDAYATGQALYALSFAGVASGRTEVQRGIAFLAATQREDGSWPMTSRDHPGVESTRKPLRNPVPITYFGSAWGTLGLARSVPPAADTAAKRQYAFDHIRSYHGKYEVDDKSPDKAVVRVDLRYYDVPDDAVQEFARALQAFPRLTTLQLKSSKITDAGLAHLKMLPRLRSLTIENAPITDLGLGHLKALTELQELQLKGTKVSDAGVETFRKALPNVKVER